MGNVEGGLGGEDDTGVAGVVGKQDVVAVELVVVGKVGEGVLGFFWTVANK
jgi:hypothetical protein